MILLIMILQKKRDKIMCINLKWNKAQWNELMFTFPCIKNNKVYQNSQKKRVSTLFEKWIETLDVVLV